jgi:hypothetical protein
MARERLITKRVNIFDGQRVTEVDLDTEQIHNNTVSADIVKDFHGSGVVNDTPFETRILLDTRSPGLYIENGNENPSKSDIESGTYDGKGISLDRQTSDPVRGNRVEFELVDSEMLGRKKVKIMVLGRAFDGLNSQGELVAEFIEFGENSKKLSKHYYTRIISVLFNDFSGGSGRTENLTSVDSLDLISNTNGYMIVRETEPLKVFPASVVSYQVESPNLDMINFITSDPTRTVRDEIILALGSTNTISDLYVELLGREEITLAKDAATSIKYGQKFLSEVDNLQRIDILMSVERDATRPAGSQFDFSGDLVMSIHELSSDIDCPTDAVPEDLIDYDPEITPLIEISFGQGDLEALGFSLTDTPQIVSFNFAGTLLADPNLEPSIKSGKFYSFLIRRSGDNRTGTIILEKGFDKVFGKTESNVTLTPIERFGKRTSKYTEFDPITKRFINDSQSSLWYRVHSDALEITNGTAYADTGKAVTIPKTIGFIGNTEISNFEKNITLRTVAEGSNNYVILSHIEEFTDPGTHPRTGNFLFTRIVDGAALSVVNDTELDDILEDTVPLLLGRVVDTNVRDAQTITGTLDKPGLISNDTILLIDPGADVLAANLINRVITPDIDCDCNSIYRIADVDCLLLRPGDFDSDGKYTSSDLTGMLGVVGNTINSEVTERSILGGEIDILDFIRGDLDANDTIDGTDIELLEDAVDGYVNFVVPQEIKVLQLRLENILEADDNPIIFSDALSTGVTTPGEDILGFSVLTENQGLIIRPGDTVEIDAVSLDSGIYKIATKTVEADGVTITVTVTTLDDASVSFNGTSAFNVTVTSGTEVNVLADNNNLVDIPFSSTNFEISFIENPFEERFVEVCDLRRFVGASFLELSGVGSCECEDPTCISGSVCSPQYKNQTLIPGDLFVTNGNILSAPGIPYHGDYEYANIVVPLPPGNISDCSVNLYDAFVKGANGTCSTAAGYPAMKYSDGTVVGCEDAGSSTDISKGRVKFSHEICSICVDALVDGYVDGYVAEEDTSDFVTSNTEVIAENYIDDSFTEFSSWVENPLNNTTITNIDHPSGSNQPAIFDLTTASDSGERFGRLDAPVAVQGFAGDFITDFRVARTTWPGSSVISGEVSSFGTIVITNADGGISTLKLGWRVLGGQVTKMFYSGVIEDPSSIIISTFNFEIDAPDVGGEDTIFRLRRVNDVVFAYYIIPNRISESTVNSFGEYVRIGANPEVQPGVGTADFSYEILQNNSPTSGLVFFTRLSETIIQSEYTSNNSQTILAIGRDSVTSLTDRATLTFPVNLTGRTSITEAILSLNSQSSGTITDSFNIIPLDILNSDNIGSIFNIPLEEDVSVMTTFVPGVISVDENINIDVTQLMISLLSKQGHLPGFFKGFVIEPDASADSTFDILSLANLTVTFLDESTGIVFKVGISIDQDTGIATFSTRNILYDSIIEENRTVINFGVYLKKGGFKNQDVSIGIADLDRLGIGSCSDSETFAEEEECFFVAGSTAVGTFIEGPFPCFFSLA